MRPRHTRRAEWLLGLVVAIAVTVAIVSSIFSGHRNRSGAGAEPTSVAFSPDGRTLAAGRDDGSIQLWDVSSHRRLGRSLHPRISHDLRAEVRNVAFSPDGRTLAAAGDVYVPNTDYSQSVEHNGYVWLWNVRRRDQGAVALDTASDTATGVAFSPDGRNLVSSSEIDPDICPRCSGIRLWALRTHKLRAQFPAYGYSFGSVAFSPDGRTLASADDYGVWLWDVRSHRQLAQLGG